MAGRIITVSKNLGIDNLVKRLENADLKKLHRVLGKYGKQGVEALQQATPKRTGLTANSWYYEIQDKDGMAYLIFKNSNVVNNWYNVAIMLQYGHGTQSGAYVEGIDYINPALKPIFEKIAERALIGVMEK